MKKNRAVSLTEEGHIKSRGAFGLKIFTQLKMLCYRTLFDQALKANYIFQKDVDYVVKDDQIIIVDEFTGRLSEGKEEDLVKDFTKHLKQKKVAIQEESQTLADTTYQNYFRMYKKLSGMTGTAQTEATEFTNL